MSMLVPGAIPSSTLPETLCTATLPSRGEPVRRSPETDFTVVEPPTAPPELRLQLDRPQWDLLGGDLPLQLLGELQDPEMLAGARLWRLQPPGNALRSHVRVDQPRVRATGSVFRRRSFSSSASMSRSLCSSSSPEPAGRMMADSSMTAAR